MFLAHSYLCRAGPNASPGSALGWLPVLALLAAPSAATTTCLLPVPSTGCGRRAGARAPATAVLADGFSCRTQIEVGHLGRKGIHLASPLAGMLGENPDGRENQS